MTRVWGTFSVIWRTGYCDEERVRWFGRYFRHYCLEGATTRANDNPYMLAHVRNPDFADGVQEWTLEPAAKDGIKAGQAKQFDKLVGRYYRGPDTFLTTRRDAQRPNVFSQPIRDLQPGRLYSVKMFTGDYDDLVAGRSRKQVHPVRLEIAGGTLLDGARHQYQTPFPTRKELKPFSEKKPFWLNYHWRVFRANETTGMLRVSDWKNAEQPGGPAGQQLLYTFVEVKPYLNDE